MNANMRQDDDAIFAEMHVRLDGVSTGLDCAFKGPYRILWACRFVATMSNSLR